MAAVICGVCLWSRQGRETEVCQSESECERVGKGDKGRGIEEQSRDEEVDSFSQTQQTIGAGYRRGLSTDLPGCFAATGPL